MAFRANKSRNRTNQSRLLWVQPALALTLKLSESAAPEIIEITDANNIEQKLICKRREIKAKFICTSQRRVRAK